MEPPLFRTPAGHKIPAVTADEMRDVDRVAVETVGLQILQMMENAGRALAWHVRNVHTRGDSTAVVIAGNGGNGGGGLACARHLANRDIPVSVVLDRHADELTGAAAHQHGILTEMDIPIQTDTQELSNSEEGTVIIDALIGYGLRGRVRSRASTLIECMNSHPGEVVSLDVPSGINSTTGETLGSAVDPTRTVTLALPKTGLDGVPGTVFLADIGIPYTVYERLGIEYHCPFDEADWVRISID